MPSSACDWSSDVCSSDRSEEHTSELQSRSDLVCRIISSEEHTSELQSRSDLVCRLLLEKKKKRYTTLEHVLQEEGYKPVYGLDDARKTMTGEPLSETRSL